MLLETFGHYVLPLSLPIYYVPVTETPRTTEGSILDPLQSGVAFHFRRKVRGRTSSLTGLCTDKTTGKTSTY